MAKFRKLSALALISALALSAAGCASGAGAGGSATSGGELTYWSMWKEGEAQQKVVASAISDFEKESGVKVTVQWQGRDNIKKAVPTLNTNKVPDLLDGSLAKLAPVLAETKQAKPLTEAYAAEADGKKISDLIPKAYLKGDTLTVKGEDAPWMLPYSLTSDAIWFNAAEHPELVDSPPKTWDDFLAVMDKMKAAGQTPLAIDGDVAGYNAYWYTSAMVRLDGPGALKKIASDKTGAGWDSPDALKAAEMVEQLVKGGYFISGYNASKWPAQQQAWADNKAALLFNGTWIPTETGPYAAAGMKYSSFPFPLVDGGSKAARADFVGFAVPARAHNADNAQKLAAFFLQKKYQDALGTDAKILPIRSDATVSEEMSTVKAALTSAGSYFLQNDGITFPGYTEKLLWPALNDLVLGKTSAKDFVQTMKTGQIDYWKQNS
ncbi:MAG: extracellular solute-binding protein [Actinobacteria bacterium]|nr:extracellular solute-binding protein [Actinomycetota bacterium]